MTDSDSLRLRELKMVICMSTFIIGIVIEMKENNENAQIHSLLKNLFPANMFCLEHVCLITSVNIQMYSRLLLPWKQTL